MPGAGGTQRRPRLSGKHRALDLLLTGAELSAAEAYALGAVSRLVADDDGDAEALAVASSIAAMPPLAVRQIKDVVLAGLDCSLEAGLALERNAMQQIGRAHV